MKIYNSNELEWCVSLFTTLYFKPICFSAPSTCKDYSAILIDFLIAEYCTDQCISMIISELRNDRIMFPFYNILNFWISAYPFPPHGPITQENHYIHIQSGYCNYSENRIPIRMHCGGVFIVGTIKPSWQAALLPPTLTWSYGKVRVTSFPCSIGKMGSVTTLPHVESRVSHFDSEIMNIMVHNHHYHY